MPHSFGYRNGTRRLFKKKFGTKGRCHTTTYLRTFKRGDYVDIKVDSSIHKGMPHKFYHGRTGVVFNVTKRAIGVTVNKQVNTRIVKKMVHIAVPHLKPSTCQSDIIARKVTNEAHKLAVRSGKAQKKSLKRVNALPRESFYYNLSETPETIQPTPYVDLV